MVEQQNITERRRDLKSITIRIDDDQFNKLQNINKTFKMNGISCLIRRSIDVYINTFPESDIYIQYINERRKSKHEYDEHFKSY